jgi:hypothetical protein
MEILIIGTKVRNNFAEKRGKVREEVKVKGDYSCTISSHINPTKINKRKKGNADKYVEYTLQKGKFSIT